MESDTTIGIPKVSVVMPCYNLGSYLDEAVNSVLRQSMQDFEIIIVNDGSSDEYTIRLLSDYNVPKVRIFQIENRGPGGARNYGISRARAPYILCLDPDDIIEQRCLEKALRVLEEKPEVGIASFWYRNFGEGDGGCSPDSCTLEDILIDNKICGGCMFRKSAWQAVGGYDEKLVGYEDWDLWINILARGYKCYVIREVLFNYRIRKDSKVQKDNLPSRRNITIQSIVAKHSDLFRAHADAVIIGKERIISDLLECRRQLIENVEQHAKRTEPLGVPK
jgi:glycosyltransferase involved in cell wall biosynthesis